MKTEFEENIVLRPKHHAILKSAVKMSHASWIYSSIDGLTNSRTANLCGIYADNELVSFAWYMQRNLLINDCTYKGLSIGIVTTMPLKRNHGYASKLLKSIEELARNRELDFLLLAGIPKFYSRLGFEGFAPKSKLIFKRSDLPKTHGSIVPLEAHHLEMTASMQSSYAEVISAFSRRTNSEWKDLLGPLSSTFLFYNPMVVLDDSGYILAYFCCTPNEPTIIREFVPRLSTELVVTALSVISNSPQFCTRENIEIYAPAKGPVWHAAAKRLGADYISFLRPRSSNMIKWISASKCIKNFHCEFILQGDIL
jgi:predicted acetyltransferase